MDATPTPPLAPTPSSDPTSPPAAAPPPAASGALSGIRVIDASRVLGGPYATQVLADHGAEVIKIEPPRGDETRHWGPPFLAPDVSWYFAGVNRNKDFRTLDLKTPAGVDEFRELLATADVLVENFRSGTLADWGLDYESALRVDYPRLVVCSITGFGDDGPLGGLPGYDAVVQAVTGMMSVNGRAESGPTRIGMPAVDMFTGMYAATGILMALQERARSGRGQRVETTLFDCALSMMHPHFPNYFGTGRSQERTGNDHPNITPYSTYRVGEGHIFLAVGNDRQFATLCVHLGIPELPDDPRFACNAARTRHRPELRRLLEAALEPFDAEDLGRQLSKLGVPCGPILDVQQAVNHPHTAHREMLVELDGGYRGVASPIKLSRTPASYRIPPGAQAPIGDRTPNGEQASPGGQTPIGAQIPNGDQALIGEQTPTEDPWPPQ